MLLMYDPSSKLLVWCKDSGHRKHPKRLPGKAFRGSRDFRHYQ